MNKIFLTARLARDPKIHKAMDNQSVLSNALAVRKFSPTEKFVRVQSYTTRNGEPRKKFFVNVVRAESDND